MLKYVARRGAAIVPLLLLVSIGAYSLILLVPGDPAISLSGDNPTQEQIAATRERLGLDQPIIVQYLKWVGGALRGDLGKSLFTGQRVADAITQALPVTTFLTLGALVVAITISIPAGVIAATHRGRWPDRLATIFASAGVAIPGFWLGIVLVLTFSLHWKLFPATGYRPFSDGVWPWLRALVLPSVTLGVAAAAETTRQLRGALVDVLSQDYVRTARSKGMSELVVVGKHALKNAATPALTVLGFQVAFLMGGAVVVEQVFGLPGLGTLAVRAVMQRDLPMIQGIVLTAAVVVLLVNLLIDLLYGYFDPRTSHA